ncbi:Vacuolar sorting protein 9 [Plasmopara halstedii]|uniref:Vacuolar sorting protein 9 n=1 Tax=Plasmopara halstedii TaxID=4781 RepID=A0A0P1ALM9_PLAHL|nr:Vacuolar sorting protein 9 [Plasmopara halstedii]CEG42216.1 Vacuolar sorting protein 9 [Plasmopara halstedii]|eukprot:XP_024578585.1 Vacuolar sorting protein 9 [Plasmopara halstedii]
MEKLTESPCLVFDEVLHDEDCAEMALEHENIERVMDGQCLVEQLSLTQIPTVKHRKRRRTRTVDADLELQCLHDDVQFEKDSLLYSSNAKESDTEDGANALVAVFESADSDQNQTLREQPELLRMKFPHTPSASFMRVCCCGERNRSTMAEDEAFESHSAFREYLDLHIRYAVVVRVVRVEIVDGQVIFVLKVSDAETQKRWKVNKTLKEMMQFYSQIQQISLLDAPVKRSLWGTFQGLRNCKLPKKFLRCRGSLNAQRRVIFDSFLRQTAALVAPAPLGIRRRKAVLLLQEFVGVHRHCNVFHRTSCTCFSPESQVYACHLVTSIFGLRNHDVTIACTSLVTILITSSRDEKHANMSQCKARMLLNTISRKMGEIVNRMLRDKMLLSQLAVARSTRPDSDYDELIDEVKHSVCSFVQMRVLVPLEDHVYEALHTVTDWEDEIALKNKIKVLQTKPQSFFGVPPHIVAISGKDWEDARRELRCVNEYALPLDKLKCLARAAGAIFQACGSSRLSSFHDTIGSLTSIEDLDMTLRPSITTDEFITVHLFVLVMSNMSQILITREFLRIMCDPQDITGELGYYLTTFEVAVDLLINHIDLEQPLIPSK